MVLARHSCSDEATAGLFGCGSLSDGDGEPLRPGGLALTRELIDLAGFRAGDRVVDVGCGLGASTQLLAERGVAAVGVDLVARHGAAAFVVADAARLPFADHSIDGILSECSLSLVDDRRQALAEWRRVLRIGGRLGLSDVYRRSGDGGDGRRIATRDALCAETAAAGFHVERFEDRSTTLKAWAARFIFQHGSLDALWGAAGAGAKGRLGYGLLIAVNTGARAPAGG